MDNPFKILFIKPSRGRGPQAIDVPLGFLYLSACLKRYLKKYVEVELIDLRLTREAGPALIEKLNTFQPALIGISLLAGDKGFLNEWSSFIKQNAPDAKIVIGGPAAIYEYDELLLVNRAVDWAVVGEGEIVFVNLVRALITGETINQLDGLAYVDGEKVVRTPPGEYIEDLDTIPFPDYGLVNLSRYFVNRNSSMNVFLWKRRYAPIISSRGCPYNCIYCHSIFGKKVRKRSPENFVGEIRWLYHELGIREFHIVDDIFNIDRVRMREILDLIIKSDMSIKLAFPNGLRADLLEKEDILLMKRAGAYILTFAVESASPRIQKIIRKNLNIAKVLENIEYAKSIGLIVKGYFMLGFPGETIEEIYKTISLARKSRLDLASFFMVIPYKGTALALLNERMYPEVTYDARGDFYDENPFYALANGYNLKRTQIYAYLAFYLPFRIFTTLIRVPRKLPIIFWFFWFAQLAFSKRVKSSPMVKTDHS